MGCAEEPGPVLHPVPRAMVQNHCRQVKAPTFQLLPNWAEPGGAGEEGSHHHLHRGRGLGAPQGQPAPSPAEPTRTSLDQQIPHTLPPIPSSLGPTVSSWFRSSPPASWGPPFYPQP